MPKTIKDVKKEVKAGSDIMENLLGGGFDAQTVRDNNVLINKIRQTISRNSDFSKEQTGLSLITLLNRDLLETKAVKGKDGSTETKQLINLDALLNNSENTIALSGILASESSRLELYRDYQRIYDLIPQLASAVDRYVESIISPDDPVKNSLTTVYTKPQTGEREESIVKLGMEHIVKKYNLNKLTPKIIKEALIKGDCFYAVIAARDRVNAILSEENRNGEHRDQDVVNESSAESTLQILVEDDYFRPDVEKYLDHKFALYEERLESLKGDKALYEEKLQKLNESKRTSQKFYTDASHVVTKCINENIIISDSSSLLAEESEVIQSLQMTEPPTLGSQKTPSIHVASRRFGYKGERDLNRDTKYTSIFSEPRDRNDKTISDDFLIKGSILKRLDPERVVKLERDGMEFGYLYFENFEEANFMSTLTYESDIKVFDKIFGKINSRDDIDKRNLIYNMFIRGISKRINKASFEKFPEFSEAICKLLDQDNIIQKQIRITYFRPEEVVHFGKDDSESVYYESLYRRILFTAKIYLSMLSTYTLYKLVRAPSKRLFYIEVGLDNDDGEAVSSFVRDLKTKELKFNDIATSSINNVLSLISCFNDIFIPTVDGQKPIEMETATEDSPNMDSDFKDQLMKDMLSGMSVPSAAISEGDNLSFSRQIAQENLFFMKMVILLQQIFDGQFTKLLQTLYVNEFPEQLGYNAHRKAKVTDKEMEQIYVNPDYIAVQFPVPTSLLVTVAQDQSQNVSGFAEFISNVFLGQDNQSDAQYATKKNALFRVVAQKFLPNIDWEVLKKLYENALIEAARNKVESDADNAEDTDTSTQYADNDAGGDFGGY